MAGHRLVVEVEFDKEKFENMIDAYKAAHPDLIDVVRCRDCIHRDRYECNHISLGQTQLGVRDDWYCADGKRRTENG